RWNCSRRLPQPRLLVLFTDESQQAVPGFGVGRDARTDAVEFLEQFAGTWVGGLGGRRLQAFDNLEEWLSSLAARALGSNGGEPGIGNLAECEQVVGRGCFGGRLRGFAACRLGQPRRLSHANQLEDAFAGEQ